VLIESAHDRAKGLFRLLLPAGPGAAVGVAIISTFTTRSGLLNGLLTLIPGRLVGINWTRPGLLSWAFRG
jgi:hypothetical protein